MATAASRNRLNQIRLFIIDEFETQGRTGYADRIRTAFTRQNLDTVRALFNQLESECWQARFASWEPHWSGIQDDIHARLAAGGLTTAHIDALAADPDERVWQAYRAMIVCVAFAVWRIRAGG